MSGRAVLFLDSREALSGAKRILGRKFLDIEKVALTPEACHLLDKIGVPYRTPEEFYDVGDLWKIETENMERLYHWCDWADALLREHLPEIGRLRLRPTRYNIYMWYLLINTLASRQHSLDQALTGLAPGRMVITDHLPGASRSRGIRPARTSELLPAPDAPRSATSPLDSSRPASRLTSPARP